MATVNTIEDVFTSTRVASAQQLLLTQNLGLEEFKIDTPEQLRQTLGMLQAQITRLAGLMGIVHDNFQTLYANDGSLNTGFSLTTNEALTAGPTTLGAAADLVTKTITTTGRPMLILATVAVEYDQSTDSNQTVTLLLKEDSTTLKTHVLQVYNKDTAVGHISSNSVALVDVRTPTADSHSYVLNGAVATTSGSGTVAASNMDITIVEL